MNIEDLISQYIDGTLPGEAEAELHHRLAVSPEARALFRAHIMLKGVARDQRVLHAPTPDLRSKLFGRLEREEGMVLPAISDTPTAAGAVPPVAAAPSVASAPARSIPSDLVKGKSARRRRRVVPWLIPILMAGLMIAVLWNVGDNDAGKGNGSIAGTKVEEIPAAPGGQNGAAGNPSAPSADHMSDAGPMSDRDAAASETAAGRATGSIGEAQESAASGSADRVSPSNGILGQSAPSSDASGTPAYKYDSDGGKRANAEGKGSGASAADFSAKEDGRMERSLGYRAAPNQSGPVSSEGTVVHNDKWAREEAPRNRHYVSKPSLDSARITSRDVDFDDEAKIEAKGDIAAMKRADRIAMENSSPSIRSDADISVPTTTQSRSSNGRANTRSADGLDAISSASKPESFKTTSVPPATATVESSGGKNNRQLLSSNPSDSSGQARNGEALQSGRPLPTMAMAPPPPPSGSFGEGMYGGGAAAETNASVSPQAEAEPERKAPSKEMAVSSEKAVSKDKAEPSKAAADESRIANSMTSSMEDAPLSPSFAPSDRFMLGLEPSVSLAGSNATPQVTLKFGVELGGKHRIYAMGGMSGYQEGTLDMVLRATSNGVDVTPTGPSTARDTTGKFNELWGGAGYRYSFRLTRRLSFGLGGWAGAGKRYYRLGSELPLTLDLNRSISLELVPSLQYIHPFSGAGTTEETAIDLTLPYSEQRRRTKNPLGTGDLNFGVGVGVFWTW